MKTDQNQRKYLSEYQSPDFTITSTDLDFTLHQGVTTVKSRLQLQRLNPDPSVPLRLDGEDLKIVDLRIDDDYLDDPDFTYDGKLLTIATVPDSFVFYATVEIDPAENTRLEGLYQSNGVYCTQCEAEGFRLITFYIDRPDVMSVFTTTVRAQQKAYPFLLSNGNKVDSGVNGDMHWTKWSDPHPKPCYLFALVAGDLACVSDRFTTVSGREVSIEFYTEHHNRDKCGHAITSLQNAMRWDEEVYGLEYDLDLYMVVAVDDFNMGAMENKGLNVFNTKYVLANPQSATDDDYRNIEGVIAHEYFHNWTGNRVTCRDWFQLSLKEGLTVFRDQEFSSDMQSRAIQRINDVRVLRAHQFSEDAGPMAHPVRPASYLEINNFYTVTVYNKGAEVVRMYQTLLGREGFRKGMDLYFQRHDGQAVTTDDFRRAMQDANRYDLTRFQRWYDQAGTPRLSVNREYDADRKTLLLKFVQHPGRTHDEENQPFMIPVKLALFNAAGDPLPLDESGATEQVLVVDQAEQSFEFNAVPEKPLVSLLRGFSAPVRLQTDLGRDELVRLMTCDSDAFNRWDAAQQIATQVMLELVDSAELRPTAGLEALLAAFEEMLDESAPDRALQAEMLRLPSEKYLAELCQPVDIHSIHQVREFVKQQVAERLQQRFVEIYRDSQVSGSYQLDPAAMGKRALSGVCLSYLTLTGQQDYFDMAQQQFDSSTNMTDQMAALMAVVHYDNGYKKSMFKAFYDQWSDTPLVVDKWFSALASSHASNALDEILRLEGHKAFNILNPNRARSLIGSLQANAVVFHDSSGRGYQYLADKVIELDAVNPQIAARMAAGFLNWRKLIPELGEKMKRQILRIQARPGLSNDVAELMASCLVDPD